MKWKIRHLLLLISFFELGCIQHPTNDNSSSLNYSSTDTAADSAASRMKRFKASAIKGKLLGLWIDTSQSSTIEDKTGYKLAKDNKNQLYITHCDPDSEAHSKNAITMIDGLASQVRRDKKDHYTDIETNDRYIVNKAGDLSIYDNNGWVVTCKKIF